MSVSQPTWSSSKTSRGHEKRPKSVASYPYEAEPQADAEPGWVDGCCFFLWVRSGWTQQVDGKVVDR